MYFDRILFSAVFATLIGTAVLALVPAATPDTQTVAQTTTPALPSLERVVVTGKKEASRI